MFRTMLLIFCLAATPAFAGESHGHVELATGGLRGLTFFADMDRTVGEIGVGRQIDETSMAGIAWRRDGLRLSAGVGLFGYDFTGVGEGKGRIASFAIGHELATGSVGALSLELRHTRLWEGETGVGITSARLGWSIKF